MHTARFVESAQRISARLSRRTSLGILAVTFLPLADLSDPATARKKKKVTFCLNGQTIKKPKKQAKKLARQGATKGACGSTCVPAGNCCIDDDCEGTDTCQNGNCITPGCGTGGSCRVFVTSVGRTGDAIGGLAGADALCQGAAAALGGTYEAWLSAFPQTPGTRFANIERAGPYRLIGNETDGSDPAPVVAVNFTDLVTCDAANECLLHAIDRTETGGQVTGFPGVWTGTISDGSGTSETCAGWGPGDPSNQGAVGRPESTTQSWTAVLAETCATTSNRLYCFEQAI